MGYVKWTVKRNVEVILNAVVAGKLKLGHLITHEYHYSDALEAYQELAKPNTNAMAVVLKYSI